MNTQRLASALALSLLTATPSAYAGPGYPREGGSRFDYAEVVRVEPITREVRVSTPREECWDEDVPVRESSYSSATPMILGGIIGGVVGHTMGKGHGKDAATVAGTVLGGSIGRDIGAQHRTPDGYRTVQETHCRQVEDYREEQRVEGYRVFYRYQGEEYETRMPHDPGERIRVQVSVQPAW
ncbi:MAG: glycine zipper 2TM domain-containing protein [Gammaproteobacteria bacterium]|nr:glycine zipper 2TM domain-containing protein [Gammaproteobacteria bacterium]